MATAPIDNILYNSITEHEDMQYTVYIRTLTTTIPTDGKFNTTREIRNNEEPFEYCRPVFAIP